MSDKERAVESLDFTKVVIPPRPEAMIKVSDQARSDDPNLNAIAEAIGSDVGLSGAVLQVVNSPFYGLKRKINNIMQATQLLGIQKVDKLVASVSLRSQVGSSPDLGRFWDNAEELANISSIIAQRLGGVDVSDAYMLGLFHDCGIPIMMQQFDDYKDTLRDANTGVINGLTQYEMQKYGIDHASVGYKLAQEWFLEEHMCEAILYHHECDDIFNDIDASSSSAVTLLAILKFAEEIAFEIHQGSRTDTLTDWAQIGDTILEYLNVSESDFAELKDDFIERLENTA